MAKKTACYAAGGPAGVELVSCTMQGKDDSACRTCLEKFNESMGKECELPEVMDSIYEEAKAKVTGSCHELFHTKECVERLQQASVALKECYQPSEQAPSCNDCSSEFEKYMEPCEDQTQTMKKARQVLAHATNACEKASDTGHCALKLRDAASELSSCTQKAVQRSDATECEPCINKYEGDLGICRDTFKESSETTIRLARSTCSSLQDKVAAFQTLKGSMTNMNLHMQNMRNSLGNYKFLGAANGGDDKDDLQTSEREYTGPGRDSGHSTSTAVWVIGAITIVGLCVALSQPRFPSRPASGRMHEPAGSGNEGQE
jgi:hypothetical protein